MKKNENKKKQNKNKNKNKKHTNTRKDLNQGAVIIQTPSFIARKLISFGNKAVKKCNKKNSVPEYPYAQLCILRCTFGTGL